MYTDPSEYVIRTLEGKLVDTISVYLSPCSSNLLVKLPDEYYGKDVQYHSVMI